MDITKYHEKNEKICFQIFNVLTRTECEDLIKFSEENIYEPATIDHGEEIIDESIRKHERFISYNNKIMSGKIWAKILNKLTNDPILLKKVLKLNDDDWICVGVNDCLRYLKYDNGDYFMNHVDDFYISQGDFYQKSFLTILIYLNDTFEGGETKINDIDCKVKPVIGSVLIFNHDINHEGCPVTSGMKYVIRTDMMYTNTH